LTTDKRIIETVNFYLDNGEDLTLEQFGVSSETLHRYKRAYKKSAEDFELKNDLRKIKENYTEAELKTMAKGGGFHNNHHTRVIDFDGKEVTFGFMTDTHIGSEAFNPDYMRAAFKEFDKQKCDFWMHAGDLVEGMSNRAGHIYECTHLGYEQQKNYAIELLSETELPGYLIDGNHDRWYIKSGNTGALIVKDICQQFDNLTFLGHDEGDLVINGVTIKLWHGEDGSSYAISYRLQKLAESFTGGEKPQLLLAGHVHKMGYFFIRNIHMISGGAIQKQSAWMRRTKKASHTGFWIVKMCLGDDEIKWIEPRFYPFY